MPQAAQSLAGSRTGTALTSTTASSGRISRTGRGADGRTVLGEDDYVALIGQIIERDFFPSLPQLRLQAAYLEALEQRDRDRAEQLFWALQDDAAQTLTRDPDSPTTLAAFQNRYTSQDNASFERMLRRARRLQRHRFAWAFRRPADPRNALMFYPDAVLPSSSSDRGAISYAATGSLVQLPNSSAQSVPGRVVSAEGSALTFRAPAPRAPGSVASTATSRSSVRGRSPAVPSSIDPQLRASYSQRRSRSVRSSSSVG